MATIDDILMLFVLTIKKLIFTVREEGKKNARESCYIVLDIIGCHILPGRIKLIKDQ